MLNCGLVVDVGSDFDSLNFAPFRQPYLAVVKTIKVACLAVVTREVITSETRLRYS